MKVYTCASTGQSITLTKCVGGGGEGEIWQTNRNGYVAKIYKKPLTFEIVQKLEVMVAFPPQEPNSHLNHISFAWPKSLLKDVYGNCVGFLMPEIKEGKQLLEIYNPRQRKSQKLEIDWRFLHTTALNIASIIQAIHAAGYILGDIKPQNILVNNRALPSIIDTDSFQVRHPLTGTLYRCEVGSPGFTPPELIKKDFPNIDQKQSHDNFRLAVIIYHLLFTRSPFQGKWMGAGEAPEVDELVQRGLWAYAPDMSIQPLEILPLDIVHPQLQQSFLKCFNDGHRNPNIRPTASYWVRVLKVAINELTLCGKFDNHYYSQNYGKCYWCECATNFKVDYFPGIVIPQSQVAPSRQAPNSNNQSNPAPQTVPSSSSTAALSVKQNQSINSSNTINNNPNTSNSASKKLNNSQISNANKSVSKTVHHSSRNGRNNDGHFISWLFVLNLFLIGYTCQHYFNAPFSTTSLYVWVFIWALLSTCLGFAFSFKTLGLSEFNNVIPSSTLPLIGVINTFIYPHNFVNGLWLFIFVPGLFIVIASNYEQFTKKPIFINIFSSNILALMSLAINSFTIYYCTINAKELDIYWVLCWSIIIFLIGAAISFYSHEKMWIISKINLAVCLPVVGVINCFVYPKSFSRGWWLILILSFIVILGVSLSQIYIINKINNSNLQMSIKAFFIKIFEVLVIIFVFVLAGYTYSTKITDFDTSGFTKVILQEDFQNSNINDWLLIDGAKIKDEALFQLVPKQNTIGLSTWNKSRFKNLKDVDFSADVGKISGSDDEYFGIITRNYNSFYLGYYYLLINGNGKVKFGKFSEFSAKKFINSEVSLKEVTVNSTLINRLRIVCSGDRIVGYINGKMIGRFEDSFISSGKIGFLSSTGEREGVAVYFDNVLVKSK